jgi:hypothetical protein
VTGRPGLPELILAIQPEMRELLLLREEVVALRFKRAPPTPTLAALMEGTPITVKQDDNGKWSTTIDLGPDCARTGGSGYDTDVDAFKRGIAHLADLLAREWSREDDE